MSIKRRRELRLIHGRCTFNDRLIRDINELLRTANAESNEEFIPLLEAAALQYWSYKKQPNKGRVSAVNKAVTDALDKLAKADEAIRAAYGLTSPDVHSSPGFARWERQAEDINRELAAMKAAFEGDRTPKNEEEIVFARKIGWAIDRGTNAKRTTSPGKLWDNLLFLLIQDIGYEPTNTAKILLKAHKDM